MTTDCRWASNFCSFVQVEEVEGGRSRRRERRRERESFCVEGQSKANFQRAETARTFDGGRGEVGVGVVVG